MNASPTRLALVLILLACTAIAHVPLISPLVIPKGEERTFYIVADVEEENPTFYSHVPGHDESVAKVTSKLNFAQKFYGSWTIKGVEVGTTTITFHWRYPKDKSGNEGDRDEPVMVQVVPPGSAAATNQYHLTIADPVNTRNGEYFGEEAMDFNLRGPMPLTFSRYYSSSLVADGVTAGALGANRLHSFDWRLNVELPDRRVAVRTDRGRIVRFEKRFLKDKGWTQVGRMDEVFSLIEDASGFSFSSPASQMIWKFDTAGKLISISDGRGNTHTLTYSGTLLATVADGQGRTLTFAHTGGRMTRVTDHTGRHVDFTYTGNNLATASDTMQKVTTYAYNGAGLLASFTRPEGNTPFTQVFTGGKVTQQTERGTDITTMSYGASSTTITQPGGATMVHSYAPTGELTSYTDEGGKVVSVASDPTGRRSGVSDRMGDATGITYHEPSGLPATITNAEGATTTMSYKPRVLEGCTFFDLVKVTFPDKTSETFTYDPRGNILSQIDRAGKKWISTYNERGQPLTTTNPTGGVITMTYDGSGNLLTSRDSATGATAFAHDTLSRLTTITRPGGATVLFEYDVRDRMTRMTDERGKHTDFSYDDNNRITDITDADVNATEFGYDSLDRVVQVTDRLGKVSSHTFDARRLLASVTDRNNNTTTFGHDDRQRPITATDPGGKVWTLGFDDESLLASMQNPVDPPAPLKRNALGRLIETANSLGHTTRVSRDAMQRVVQSFDPLGRATKFTYDKRGDLVGVAEEGGGAAKFTRDALGNVTAIGAPDGGIWKNEYTEEGRLHENIDPLGNTWHHTYDTRGRLATIDHPEGTTQTLTYDDSNNVTRVQFSGGPDFNLTHDNLNRVLTASDTATIGSVTTFAYDAEDRPTSSLQNGVNFGATYDDGGRLQTVSYNGGALIVSYAYDNRNRLTSVSDNVSGATITFAHDDAGRVTSITRGNTVNATLSYDDAGRLTRIQDGTVLDLKYTLNAAGEVTAEDITAPLLPAAVPGTDTFTFGKAGQIMSSGFTYDARGRLTAAPGHTLAWDAAERLVTNGTFTNTYNAFGEMITSSSSGIETRHYHHHAIAGSPIVAEQAGPGAFTRYYVHTPGGMLLYAIDPTAANAPAYFHFDRMGSTLALTNAAGIVTDSYARGPFGENEQHNGTSTQPFTWLGQLGVRKQGALFQMRARWYDPKTARFLSRDPLPPRLADLKSLNPYSYANGNPLRYIDPNGERTFVLPHVLEKPGSTINNTQFTFDTAIFPTYTPGLGGNTRSGDASVDLYVFGTLSPVIKDPDIVRENAAKFGGVVHSSARRLVQSAMSCGAKIPCPARRKLTFRIEDNLAPQPADRAFPVKSGYGILVVGGSDPTNVTLQGFVVNSHTGPFDLSVFGFDPVPIAAAQ